MNDLLLEVSNECFVCHNFMESNQISVNYDLREGGNSVSTLIGNKFLIILFRIFSNLFQSNLRVFLFRQVRFNQRSFVGPVIDNLKNTTNLRRELRILKNI